jgi:hypothetical protein
MVTNATHYTIIVKGHLGQQWQAAFAGMTCAAQPNGTTVITGSLPDQAAVFGVLNLIERLGLILISMQSEEEQSHVE